MYIDIVPNRNSKPAILLRRSWRENGKIMKETIANFSDWPMKRVDLFKKLLKDQLNPAEDSTMRIERTLPHGHVKTILQMMNKLGMGNLISSKPCREQKLVLAMIAERLIHPSSKLGTVRLWHSSTLAREMDVHDATEDDLYHAMDWLMMRKERIEKKLGARHLSEGCLALYDTTSSYYEGSNCELARLGHNRDKKKGYPIIVYGVMTDGCGCPVSVSVYPGNTADPRTVPDQVKKLKSLFKLERVVFCGDRGTLAQTQIDCLKEYPGIGWLTALRNSKIRELASGPLQMSLFDKENIAQLYSPDFPGERLIACFNPALADERRKKRLDLLKATEKLLEKIVRQNVRRKKKIMLRDEIALRVGKVINRHKMGKHFILHIEDGKFRFEQNLESISKEAMLDGIYIIRTSEPEEVLNVEQAIRGYKSLSQVERLFRTLKRMEVRPIWHRLSRRVIAHIFICMLAYYVEWHLRAALKSVLFDDEQLVESRNERNPVSPYEPSESAKSKKKMKRASGDDKIHSFETLLVEMATLCLNFCVADHGKTNMHYETETLPTALQRKVQNLIGSYPVSGI